MRSQHSLFAFSQRDWITQDRGNIPWMKMDLNWNSQQRVLGVALPTTPLTRLVRVLVRYSPSRWWTELWATPATQPACGLIVWSVFTKAASHSAAHTALIPPTISCLRSVGIISCATAWLVFQFMKLGIWAKCLVFLFGHHDQNAVTHYLVSDWNPGVENDEVLCAASRLTQC